jgi:hypothetical protein
VLRFCVLFSDIAHFIMLVEFFYLYSIFNALRSPAVPWSSYLESSSTYAVHTVWRFRVSDIFLYPDVATRS